MGFFVCFWFVFFCCLFGGFVVFLGEVFWSNGQNSCFARLREGSDIHQAPLTAHQRYTPERRQPPCAPGKRRGLLESWDFTLSPAPLPSVQRLHLLLLLRSPPPPRAIATGQRGRCPAPRLPRPARNGGGGRTHPSPSPSAGTQNGSSPKLRSPCPVPDSGQSGAGGRTGVPKSGWRKCGGAGAPGGGLPGRRCPRPRTPEPSPAAPRGKERSGFKSDSDLRAPHGAHSRSQDRALVPASAP